MICRVLTTPGNDYLPTSWISETVACSRNTLLFRCCKAIVKEEVLFMVYFMILQVLVMYARLLVLPIHYLRASSPVVTRPQPAEVFRNLQARLQGYVPKLPCDMRERLLIICDVKPQHVKGV